MKYKGKHKEGIEPSVAVTDRVAVYFQVGTQGLRWSFARFNKTTGGIRRATSNSQQI